MPAAPLPANETARLADLAASRLLPPQPMPTLEDIVRQAATCFATPIAAITLLDGQHQHFLAKTGLDATGCARDHAFCGYAILQTAPLVVLDAPADCRFADNLLVLSAPHIRFYAGAPIYGPNGLPLGALCVIDTAAHDAVDQGTLQTLTKLADQVPASSPLGVRQAARGLPNPQRRCRSRQYHRHNCRADNNAVTPPVI